MREILFRAKRLDNGEWVEGDYCNCVWQANKEIKVPCIYAWDKFALMGLTVKIDPSTLGQFTGLTDKNGKKIFEGDIVFFNPYETHINDRIIKFENSAFVAELVRSQYHVPLYELSVNMFSVIGNIHDNPELLEVAQ